MFGWLARGALGRRLHGVAGGGRPSPGDDAWLAELVRTAGPDLASALEGLAGRHGDAPDGPRVVAVARGGPAAKALARMRRPGWVMRMSPSIRTPEGILDAFSLTHAGRAVVVRLLSGPPGGPG